MSKIGSAETWTRIAGFKVQSANDHDHDNVSELFHVSSFLLQRKTPLQTMRMFTKEELYNLFIIPVLQSQFNVRWRGTEPRSPAWQAWILPLNHLRKVAQFFRYNFHIPQDAEHFHQTPSNNNQS